MAGHSSTGGCSHHVWPYALHASVRWELAALPGAHVAMGDGNRVEGRWRTWDDAKGGCGALVLVCAVGSDCEFGNLAVERREARAARGIDDVPLAEELA